MNVSDADFWCWDPIHSQWILLPFYMDSWKLLYEEAIMQSHCRTCSNVKGVNNLILNVSAVKVENA